jgi:tetratricopeptide (TPR) repeat protein
VGQFKKLSHLFCGEIFKEEFRAMGLLDVYQGHQTWKDFISRHEGAVNSGMVALNPEGLRRANENAARLALGIEKLAGGLESLKADFNLLLGDLVWRSEMRQESLASALEEIRLAEFEREARAYRARAERSYLNGWYEEALGDFLEAEKRNYPDYTVHRSIAQIYLYHIIDLPKALEYFLKAAKYARPSDQKQAAEAHYFAGIVCVIEGRLEQALGQLEQATELNTLNWPRLITSNRASLRCSATANRLS